MARQPRVDPPGSWHHVMNRGADHQITFRDDQDRAMFIATLKRAVERFGLEIHAYCLMPNHYHLLVHSPEGQLSRAMKFIGQSYTQRFNRRHERDGALFRGRFHSILVDSDNYLDVVARYIHRNPVTKNMTDESVLDDFEWSSLAAYEGRRRRPSWMTFSEVRRRFKTHRSYAEFVRETKPDELGGFYEDPFRQQKVLGNRAFVQRIRAKLPEGASTLEPIADVHRPPGSDPGVGA